MECATLYIQNLQSYNNFENDVGYMETSINSIFSCEMLQQATHNPNVVVCLFTVELKWDGNGWIKGNVGQTGFYRVNYEEKNWDSLAEQLQYYHKVEKL